MKNEESTYISNPFKVIFKGFDALFKHNQTMTLVLFAFAFAGTLLQFIPGSGGGGRSSSPAATNTGSGTEFGAELIFAAVVIVVVMLLVMAIAAAMGTIYNGAVSYVILQTINKKTATFSETMNAVFKKFWTIFWTSVIVTLKVLGGFLLFIVPGIRASLRYKMVLLPIFDEDATAKQAIAKSKLLAKDHLIEIFGMLTAAGIIPIIGPIFEIGGQVVMYPQLKELKASGAPKPKVHWLNYLGIVLFLVLLLFIGSIVLFAVLLVP